MKILDWIFAIVLCALGVVHGALTPLVYHAITLSTLWFLAAGLALIFAGMLNIVRLKGAGSPLARTFALIANACLLAFALLFAVTVNLARNPQGVVLIIAVAGEFFFSLAKRR